MMAKTDVSARRIGEYFAYIKTQLQLISNDSKVIENTTIFRQSYYGYSNDAKGLSNTITHNKR